MHLLSGPLSTSQLGEVGKGQTWAGVKGDNCTENQSCKAPACLLPLAFRQEWDIGHLRTKPCVLLERTEGLRSSLCTLEQLTPPHWLQSLYL